MIATHLLAIALTASSIHAFTSSSINTNHRVCRVDIPLCAVDPTQALEDYLSKAHEEKLKAVKSIEDKKNEEIGSLKAEIQQLKTSSSALATTTPIPPAAPLANINTAELENKLASYQAFMADYIVKSQNEKLLAVKEAELKAEKKFQERMEKLFAAGGMALSSGETAAVDSDASAAVAVEESSFDKRNQQIIAAGSSSRWGSAEINRAIEQSKNAPTSTTSVATSVQEPVPEVSLYDLRNSQIIAAGAKSRWGSAEINRAIKNGATAATVSQATASTAAPETAFDSRNSQVVASATAGQSRWGGKEVERARGARVAAAKTQPIGLEDRINLGASTLSSSPPEVAATVFDSRNEQVVAAANAGKSRWGNMEVERAVKSGATAAVLVVKEEPTSIGLEARINLGARLLST